MLDACPAFASADVSLRRGARLRSSRDRSWPREPVPPFVNSSMDGYALRSADTDGAGIAVRCSLEVVGTDHGRDTAWDRIGPGQAARIMTGGTATRWCRRRVHARGGTNRAQRGDGGDRTDGRGRRLRPPHRSGRGCRRHRARAEGSVLTPARIGVLASQGLTDIVVYPMPRIGVLSTGDELVSGPGSARYRGRSGTPTGTPSWPWSGARDGTRSTSVSSVTTRRRSGEPSTVARDRCDAIVTSGGVSVGDLDVVKVVLQQRSAGTMRWMQVAIRPAKPFAFGRSTGRVSRCSGSRAIPVSAMVSFELFVRPAGRRMGGHATLDRPAVTADRRLGPAPGEPDGKTHFLRSRACVDAAGRLAASGC